MGTVSADLTKLATFVTEAKGMLEGPSGLHERLRALRQGYDAFIGEVVAGRSAPVANPDLMGGGDDMGEVARYARNLERDRMFVDAVRLALERASGATSGMQTVDEVDFNHWFPRMADQVVAGNHFGITAVDLLERRQPVTVDSPIAAGVPQTSGFVNDPICTATGHFLEEEEDFTWPERLSILRWRRVYSSRFVAEGPFGRGWASWASAGLAPQSDGSVAYQGPDGQLALFPARPDGLGYDRVSGVAGVLSRTLGANGGRRDGGDRPGGARQGGWELAWEWHSPHPGEVWGFDDAGRLVTVHSLVGGVARFAYRGGRLVGVDHDSGRRLDLVWDGERVVAVRSSCGRTARYRYNQAGDLIASERVLGDRSYEVDERGLIVEVVDADGIRLCRNTYDDDGRVLSQLSPFGRETVLRYHPGNRTVVSDTEDGPVAVYEHDHTGRLVGLIDHVGHRMDRAFDAEGRCVSATGFDGTTTHQSFRSDGRAATSVGPDGVEERWTYDEQHRVTSYEVEGGHAMRFDYAPDGVLPSRVSGPDGWEMHLEVTEGLLRAVTDADGVTVRLDQDRDGNVVATTNGLGATTRIEPHVSGQPAALVMPDGAMFSFDRDAAGRLLGLRTPTGDQFGMEWSAAGRMTALVEPNGARTEFETGSDGEVQRIVDALGAVIELQRDHLARLVGLAAPGGAKWGFEYTALGLLSMVTDPSGAVWEYGYDAEGRLTAATDPLGHQVRPRYNPAGRLVELVDRSGNATRYSHDALGRVVAQQDPEGAVTAYEWDALGRPTRVRLPDGETLAYSYTPAGRVRSVRTAEGRAWTNTYDEGGRLVAVTDAMEATTRFEWDACDRLTAVTAASGRVERYTHDGCGRLVEVERAGRVWRTEYDHAGRVTASIDPLGAATRYQYDLAGRLVAATDPLGSTVRVRYDERGNPTGLVDPFGGLVTTTYDAMRRPVVVTDQLGRVTRIERDATGRVVRQQLATGDVVEWRRDARGQATDVRVNGRDVLVFDRDRTGRPVVIHEPARNRTFSLGWTPGGRLRSLDVDGAELRWEHDADGLVSARRDPAGRLTRYIRDAAGRLSVVSLEGWGRIDLDRDADGRLAALRGPGIERRWDHDAQGLVATTWLSGPAGDEVTELARDAAGRVIEMRTPAGAARYRYDAAGQLVAAMRGTEAWEWHYDPAGRLAREDGPAGARTFTYDDAHQLVRIDGPQHRTTFTYDAAGRRTRETSPAHERRYGWDPLGRLIGVEIDGRHHDLDVDALGRLATVDGTPLLWDPTAAVPELLGIDDRRVISAGGMVLGQTDADGTTTWLPGDGRANTDRGDGRDPWGQPGVAEPGTGAGGPSLGYLGEVDIDGLVWLRNRVYDPRTRQFLSPDPLPGVPGMPAAANPYAYANNNPIGFVDPLGLQGRPLSIDDYNRYRAESSGWQWNNIVTVGLVVAGVAMMFVPGLNLVGAVALGTLLGAAGGAAPGLIHGFRTGEWDWHAIGGGALRGAIVGAAAGPLGRGLGALGSRFGVGLAGRFGTQLLTSGTRASTALYGGVLGAGTGAGVGALGELYDLTPLPGSDGQFDREGIGISTIFGAASGAGGAAALYKPHPAAAAATEQINLAQGQRPRPGAAGALVTADGQVFPASSVKGANPPTFNPEVQAVQDNIPPSLRGAGHNRCVEPQAVSDALNAGVDPRGGVMSTGMVRAPGNPNQGNPLPPCSSCQQLLRHYDIDWLPPGG